MKKAMSFLTFALTWCAFCLVADYELWPGRSNGWIMVYGYLAGVVGRCLSEETK